MTANNFQNVKILLTGGGTGGSVTPLLAIAEELSSEISSFISTSRDGETDKGIKNQTGGIEFLWLGTKSGPERAMVEKEGIKFKPIIGGKIRRYFSRKNFIDPILILAGFFQSLFLIIKWRPDLVISAGSFISVPVAWAAWLSGVPVMIHQLDARPGMANKLMAPFARIVTVTFEKSLKDYGHKAVWTGSPVRQELRSMKPKERSTNNKDLPVVLILGGGTGALAISNLVEKSIKELIKFCQIIHLTGKNKIKTQKNKIANYQTFEFLNSEQIARAYAEADLVVSRAGMGVLAELSYLGKPAILIPMPKSHQEDNAAMFKNAAVIIKQEELDPGKLAKEIKRVLNDENLKRNLSENINKVIKNGANENIVKIIRKIVLKE